MTGLRERKDIEKAIRAGVDDYIVKPIEPMLLLQKVEQIFIKKPPVQHLECYVPENLKLSEAQVALSVKLVRISEIGLVLHTNFSLSEGSAIDVPLDLFRRLDLKAPPMKVLSCQPLSDHRFEMRVGFHAVNENFTSTLRHWIDKNLNPKRGVA